MTTIDSFLEESTTDPVGLSTIQNGDTGSSKRSAAQLYLVGFKICIGIIGMVGNFIVLLVITQIPTQKVKFLIMSQAVIDFLTSIILVADTFSSLYPIPLPHNVVVGYLYCWLWPTQLILFGLFSVSTWNLVAISIERYIAVMHPMWYRITFSKTKAALLGLTAWIVAPTMQTAYVAIKRERFVGGQCIDNDMPDTTQIIVGVFIFLWDFFIPCVIMGVCFTRISLELIKQDKHSKVLRGYIDTKMSTISKKITKNADGNEDNTANGHTEVDTKKGTTSKGDVRKDTSAEMSRSRNVTQTFIIIFVVYVVCWSTNQCLFFQYNIGGYYIWGTPENHFANSMAILNSACNPFIYVLNMKAYREKLKAFFSSKAPEASKTQN